MLQKRERNPTYPLSGISPLPVDRDYFSSIRADKIEVGSWTGTGAKAAVGSRRSPAK